MAIGERDPYTGHMTTGHEWNGITELNTPVPRAVYFFLAVTTAFALVYWLLMPAWPLGTTYTRGLLGLDDRSNVAEELRRAASGREIWARRIESSDYQAIQSDEKLMDVVRNTGRTLFADNCSVCHGSDGRGGPGYPNLTGGSRLWGAAPDTVAETLRVGINSSHPETRTSQMLAFGRDQVLSRTEIENLVTYVQGLSKQTNPEESAALAAGKETFAANCVSCHGEDAAGNPELGAPNLTDPFWIYGGDRQSIYTSIHQGRQGHMPHWEGRLTPLDRKILTLYVLDLESAQR